MGDKVEFEVGDIVQMFIINGGTLKGTVRGTGNWFCAVNWEDGTEATITSDGKMNTSNKTPVIYLVDRPKKGEWVKREGWKVISKGDVAPWEGDYIYKTREAALEATKQGVGAIEIIWHEWVEG